MRTECACSDESLSFELCFRVYPRDPLEATRGQHRGSH